MSDVRRAQHRLQDVFRSIRGEGRLTEANVEAALREIRLALLEADVNFKVVKAFIDRVRDRAIDQEVLRSLTPAQQVVRIVRDEMLALFGDAQGGLTQTSQSPRVVMLLGLQGSGKTTTAGKLGRWLTRQGRHPMLVSTDVRRPAAIQQLSVLGQTGAVAGARPGGRARPGACARRARSPRRGTPGSTSLIVDTAGRLHIDDELMDELEAIKAAVEPTDLLYVADAMTGQDAIKSAGEFNRRDRRHRRRADASSMATRAAARRCRSCRSSACRSRLSAAASGWRTSSSFHPDRVVSRVLGMGDVLSLIEKAEAGDRRRGRGAARGEAPARRLHARGLPRSAADDRRRWGRSRASSG